MPPSQVEPRHYNEYVQIPTFYLCPDVQGILTEEHAIKVASRILNPTKTGTVNINATKVVLMSDKTQQRYVYKCVSWQNMAEGVEVYIDNYQNGRFPSASPILSGPYVIDHLPSRRLRIAGTRRSFMHYPEDLVIKCTLEDEVEVAKASEEGSSKDE